MKKIKQSIWYKSIFLKSKKTMKHSGNTYGKKARGYYRMMRKSGI